MKYEKAEQTLPDFIVKMIQEYIDGCYVYIREKKKIVRRGDSRPTIRTI